MRLFLDTSVLLSASGSSQGASRVIIENAQRQSWILLVSPYVLAEVRKNLPKVGRTAVTNWQQIESRLIVVPDVVTAGRAVVFEPGKDRPVLFTALARAQVLLTLDRGDFEKLGGYFFGLEILSPGEFLQNEIRLGRFARS